MIQQNSPQRFEWRNFRRQFRTRAIGELYLVQFEIDAETWQALETLPKDGEGEMVLWWTTRGEAPAKESKKATPKGEHGEYWRRMRTSSMLASPELRAVVGCDDESPEATVWEALHALFNVKSLSFVSPSDAAAKFEEYNLPGVASIARRLAESN